MGSAGAPSLIRRGLLRRIKGRVYLRLSNGYQYVDWADFADCAEVSKSSDQPIAEAPGMFSLYLA